jgi:putative endonuclease
MVGEERRCILPPMSGADEGAQGAAATRARSGAGSGAERQRFGELGERVAERWLRRRGWRVLQRRFRNGHRDIDLVAERDGMVAFVEVKARRGMAFGDPVEAVHWRKQRELWRSASVWIERNGRAEERYRFDVIGVLVEGSRVRVRHVENAFVPARKA